MSNAIKPLAIYQAGQRAYRLIFDSKRGSYELQWRVLGERWGAWRDTNFSPTSEKLEGMARFYEAVQRVSYDEAKHVNALLMNHRPHSTEESIQ